MNHQSAAFTKEEPWRIFRITAEFVAWFETLPQTGPAATVFGAVRAGSGDAHDPNSWP